MTINTLHIFSNLPLLPMLSFLLLLPLLSLLPLTHATSCHYMDQHPYRNFGIFTDYRAAQASLATYAIDTTPQIFAPGCQVVSFWQFTREGTSLPAHSSVAPSTAKMLVFIRDRIVVGHHLGRGELCPEDLAALVSWGGHPVEVLEAQGELTNAGARDLFLTARTYSQRFFGPQYDYTPGNFRVLYSSSDASFSSALAIVYGMAPGRHYQPVSPQLYLKESSDLTQGECRLSSQVLYGANAAEEAVLDTVTEEVTRRLGLTQDIFGKDHLHWVYDACRSALAVSPGLYSPWCAAFSQDNLQDLELIEDSIWYRRFGLDVPYYDEMLNYQIMPACNSIRHLLEYFRSVVEEGALSTHRMTSGRVIVGDASALMRLLAVFGVNKEDSPVTVTNEWMRRNRRWRSSELAPYGGHVMLALTGCHQEFFVRSYLQEIPFPILNCPVDCPWPVFRDTLEHVLEYCPDIPYCPSRGWAGQSSPPGTLAITITLVLWCTFYGSTLLL